MQPHHNDHFVLNEGTEESKHSNYHDGWSECASDYHHPWSFLSHKEFEISSWRLAEYGIWT